MESTYSKCRREIFSNCNETADNTDKDLNVHFKWNWSNVGMEVEECGGTAAEPLRDVLGIGQRRAQRYDANGLSDL